MLLAEVRLTEGVRELRTKDRRSRPPRLLLGLYDLGLCAGILAASPWLLLRVIARKRYRQGLLQRLGMRVPQRRTGRRRIWVHAASAGEIAAAAPLVRALERALPKHEIMVSSTTTSGVEVAGRLLPEKQAFILPLDVSVIVRRVMSRVDPEAVVLVELELWPNLTAAAHDQGVALCVANGRVSETTKRRYRPGWVRRLVGLHRVNLFAVQNDTIRDRLEALEVDAGRVEVTGNLKVDAEAASASLRQRMRDDMGFESDDLVVVAGSTHPGEEDGVAAAFLQLKANSQRLHLIVAPRHVERLGEAERDLKARGLAPRRLTTLRERRVIAKRPDVVLVDTMGELSSLYAAADLAIVGGSFVPGVGGHNVFEPVLAGAPVVTGPHHSNVRADVRFLRDAGAIEIAESFGSLPDLLEKLLAGRGEDLRQAATAALLRARGAADRTAALIERQLDRRNSMT